jgi:hypothetical protein
MCEVTDQTCWLISDFFYTCNMSHPPYPNWFDHSRSIYTEAQYVISPHSHLQPLSNVPIFPPAPNCFQTSWIFHHGQRSNIEDYPPLLDTKFRTCINNRQGCSVYISIFLTSIMERKTWTLSGTTSGRIRAFHFSVAFQRGTGPNQPPIHWVAAVAYPIIFFGGVQQIQLRTEGRENGDLGALCP